MYIYTYVCTRVYYVYVGYIYIYVYIHIYVYKYICIYRVIMKVKKHFRSKSSTVKIFCSDTHLKLF